jgi:hypothetical protein
VADNRDENSELLTELISTVQKKNDKEKVNDSVKSKQARVIGVDDETHKVFVYFLDDIEEKEYKFLNKTREVIGVGDTVKVFYTSNSAKGWIGERCGEPNVKEIELYGGEGVGRHPSWDKTSEYFNDYSLDKNGDPVNFVGNKGYTDNGEFHKVKAYATAKGSHCKATGTCSSAEGYGTTASGYASHAEGNNTTASGYASHAEGSDTKATVKHAHAEGYDCEASGSYSHAEGDTCKALNSATHAEGHYTTASGVYSHAEGHYTTASGVYSHAEGFCTKATSDATHAEGYYTEATYQYSHAEGLRCKAKGTNSHAEGRDTEATGYSSHAEGQETTSIGQYSHSEGYQCTARGTSAHAEGYQCEAINNYSHAEGNNCKALGYCSHVGGEYCEISSSHAFAHGKGLLVNSSDFYGKASFGQYNDDSNDIIFSVGNGVCLVDGTTTRSNAFAIDKDGNIFCKSINSITPDGSASVSLFNPYTTEQAVSSAKSIFASVMEV